MNSQDGFEVIDEYEVQDLTDVKAEKNLFPVAKDLKVRIEKAETQMNEDKDIFSLKLTLRTVEGIPGEGGEMVRINAPIFTGFMDLVYGAKLDVKGRAENKWWKNAQHVVEFKNFCTALDIPLKGVKVNDQFISELLSRELLVTVAHDAETIADPNGTLGANGKVKKIKTGDFQQRLRNWKKAA